MKKIRTLDNNRLDTVEQWIGEKQAELSDFQLLENYNFLVSTVRDYSEGVKTLRDEVANYQRNQMILQEYMHEKEVADGFDDWLKEKQEKEQEKTEDDNTEESKENDSGTESEKKED
jgi:hypothetical protein